MKETLCSEDESWMHDACMGLYLLFDQYELFVSELDVPLRRKIVDPVFSVAKQHFQTSLDGVFSFSIFCLVSEIFWFFETCKLGVLTSSTLK